MALALTACATTPAGDDPKGRGLQAEARPVLVAVLKYRNDRGHYPASLHELVPRYLPSIPFGPGLEYDREAETVAFSYELDWPRFTPVTCSARLGEVDWTCRL